MCIRRTAARGAVAVPLLWISSVAVAQTAGSGDAETDTDTAEIEAALAADAAAVEESRPAPAPSPGLSLNPDISLVLDSAFAWFTAEEPLQSGAHDPAGNGFAFQQLELDLSKVVDPYFRLDAFIVFRTEGVEVEEAFATTLALPGSLQIRAGQFLTRFGRINSQHPHVWDFADQPFAHGRMFGGEGQRGTGAEVSWLSPLPWYVEVVASTTNEAAAHGHEEEEELPEIPWGEGEEDGHIEDLYDLQHVVAIKQFFDLTDNASLMWGVSGSFTRHEAIAGTDVYFKYRPITRASNTAFIVQAEALARVRHDGGEQYTDYGGYGQAMWKFSRHWGMGMRYELAGEDELDPIATDPRHRVALQATYWPTEYSRMRLQGGLDYPQWQDEPDYSAMLAVQFIIGAHGAHKF
jgi:hypothetical protein